ncbi:MAG: branched-chain amino acid transport system II carrier protein [Eubacterium sp.]|nr:branched-chain amino acid transport system II carrier protein [Eubacterium sp.]
MERLSKKHTLLIGITLFSMFFGAGNLIFPPFLGEQAGGSAWVAFAGFAASAIGLPILGVAAVAKAGGLKILAGRVHPKFAAVFTFLIYLSIGPCLAIPRTASTSFEMALLPFVPQLAESPLPLLIYSVVFFAAALLLALKPDKLTDRLGKRLTPCLLALIFVIFAACVIFLPGGYGEVSGAYASNGLIQGFLDGYQTMDTIAALNFGIIIALNIRALGISDDRQVVRETIRAGWVAGGLLLLVYAALTHVGALTGGSFGPHANGAQTLTAVVVSLFGQAGLVILALIFLIACLNTCVGLISCCSEYFSEIFPKLSYRQWAVIFAVVSMVISNAGLNAILAVSVPVLNVLYPISILLIALAFLQRWLGSFKLVYPLSAALTGAVSLVSALDQKGLPLLSELTAKIPLYSLGLGWVLPAVLGIFLGVLLSLAFKEKWVKASPGKK